MTGAKLTALNSFIPTKSKNMLRQSMRSLHLDGQTLDADSPTAIRARERNEQCLDLLGKCFLFEPPQRITAEEAMKHPCLLPSDVAPAILEASCSGRSADTVDPDIAVPLETIPDKLLLQLDFLRELPNTRYAFTPLLSTVLTQSLLHRIMFPYQNI